MRRRSTGQSLVEMAFILPLLLLVLFGIIDLGYYIYGYATIYQAARNGSEKAAELPPDPSRLTPSLDPSDKCVNAILQAVQKGAVQFPDIANFVQIVYPTGKRELKEPVEVRITYNIEPLTPLWKFVMFGNQGMMTVQSTARRSIENLGTDPNEPDGNACKPKS